MWEPGIQFWKWKASSEKPSFSTETRFLPEAVGPILCRVDFPLRVVWWHITMVMCLCTSCLMVRLSLCGLRGSYVVASAKLSLHGSCFRNGQSQLLCQRWVYIDPLVAVPSNGLTHFFTCIFLLRYFLSFLPLWAIYRVITSTFVVLINMSGPPASDSSLVIVVTLGLPLRYSSCRSCLHFLTCNRTEYQRRWK